MTAMVGLMQNLEKLSPHPDRPNYRGALFTALPGWCKTPGQHDGMMGTMLLEGMLGGAFAEAISGAASSATGGACDSLPFSGAAAASALQAYETYRGESEGERKKAEAHGRGSFARIENKSISKSFNARSSMTGAMQDFLDDMPERLKIEGQLANFLKKLKALDLPVYTYDAPHLRYAA